MQLSDIYRKVRSNNTTPTVAWYASTDTQTGISSYRICYYQKNLPTPSGRVQCGGVCSSIVGLSSTLPSSCYNPLWGEGYISQAPRLPQPLAWFSQLWRTLLPEVWATGSTSVGGGDGTYSFEVTSYDGVGNYSSVMPRDVVIDRTPPPALTIEEPPTTPSPTNNTNPLVQWTVPQDPSVVCSGIQFFRNGPLGTTTVGGPGSNPCGSRVCPADNPARLNDFGQCYQGNGNYYVELRAQDGAGNLGPMVRKSWDIETVPPDFVMAPYGYQNGGVNYINAANQTAITFTGTCSDNWPNTLTVYIELVGPAPGDLIGGSNTCLAGGSLPPVTFDLSSFSQGAVTGQATIVDLAGNLRNYPISMVKDTVGPSVAAGDIRLQVNPNIGLNC